MAYMSQNIFSTLDSNAKSIFFFICCCWCALMFLAWMQSGCVVAGPESRGGVHDHRYGHRPGCSGAALHLLYLAQKVRASFHWHTSFTLRPTPPPRWCVHVCVCVLLSLSREYDNLKGSLKSSNDMCEKLKREVLSSNNKVIYMDVLLYPEESVLPCVRYSRLFSFSCTKPHWKLQRPGRTWSLCRSIWQMQRKRSL